MNISLDMSEVAAAAYRATSDGALAQAKPWQTALYERLSAPESDAGYLLLTPAGAGKTEAVVIPALGLQRRGAPRRLFLIGPDGDTLDDALYRLVPYLRASVFADGIARTFCLDTNEEDTEGNMCRRILADGAEDPSVEVNPLEADVDLVLTTFSRFRELFFGGGGIHALPSSMATDDEDPVRRDLFFFDEAHGYASDSFSRFHRLTEFLFAEDTDVIVGSTTMPAAFREELGFLDSLDVLPSVPGPSRTLHYRPGPDPLAQIEAEVRRSYYQNARVIAAVETPEQATELHSRLAASYPHSVFLYYPGQPAEPRRRIYAQLRELEKEGEGYLLLTVGSALETSDLDATSLLTTLCPPENLIRRAGRCNRRGELPAAQMIVFGETPAPSLRPLNPDRAAAYLAALREQSGAEFDADLWKTFI